MKHQRQLKELKEAARKAREAAEKKKADEDRKRNLAEHPDEATLAVAKAMAEKMMAEREQAFERMSRSCRISRSVAWTGTSRRQPVRGTWATTMPATK